MREPAVPPTGRRSVSVVHNQTNNDPADDHYGHDHRRADIDAGRSTTGTPGRPGVRQPKAASPTTTAAASSTAAARTQLRLQLRGRLRAD